MASAVLDSDESLAALAARGSSEAFATLYDRHFRNVYDLAARMARDSDLAGDIAQNAFVKAWDTLRKGREPEHVRAWLYTIARNTAIDEIRRQQRLVAVDDESEEHAFAAAAVATTAAADPATTAEQRELVELVWDAAASLNPREYSLLDLHVRRGLTADELATTLGQRKGAVYTMLSRLRDSLGETVTFTLLLRQGRRDCAELSALVGGNVAAELSPATRRAMRRHLQGCATCQERARRVAAPAEIFALIPLLPVAPEQQAAVWRGVAGHIDVAVAGGGVAAAAASQHPGQLFQHWWADASSLAKTVGLAATTVATATLLGGIGVLTFSGDGQPAGPPAIVGQVDGGVAVLAAATPTASTTPTLGAGAAMPAPLTSTSPLSTPTVAATAATLLAATATPILAATTLVAPAPNATDNAAAGQPAAARAPFAASGPIAMAPTTPSPLQPTATPNATATPPPTSTAAPSATASVIETPTLTPAPAASEIPTTETPAPTAEPAAPTEEPTEEPSSPREPRRPAPSTPTPRPSPPTPTPTAPAPASPPTATAMPTLPSTPTPSPIATVTATAVPAPSPTPSSTATRSIPPSATATATAAATPRSAPTATASPTATPTRAPTSTRTPTPKPPPGPAPVTRVLQSSNTDPAEPGSFVIDGKLATHWETLPITPANGWFALDLGQSRQISRARWYLGHREFAVAFRLEVSDDAQQWQTVANLSAGQSEFVWQERAINRSGRYVRWFFTNPTNAVILGEIGEAQVFME